jgi:VIT1/CCC1 family predicted Fe2+/Mn2+ transporter
MPLYWWAKNIKDHNNGEEWIMERSTDLKERLFKLQKQEITQHKIYHRLAKMAGGENGKVLSGVATDEFRHYMALEKYTGRAAIPDIFVIYLYLILARIFGITFAIKLMERGEEEAGKLYDELEKEVPEASGIKEDEQRHEEELIKLIDEERLSYISSMVLGLNDALVELTGALAGLTFVLGATKVTGTAGFITGISASLSMAASEYLSKKSDLTHSKDPIKASIYTGIMYVCATIILIIPYFIFKIPALALFFTLVNATLIILVFTFYMSVVQGTRFRRGFTEMISLSFGIAAISFVIGLLTRNVFNVNI